MQKLNLKDGLLGLEFLWGSGVIIDSVDLVIDKKN